jgi:hypothetical protein
LKKKKVKKAKPSKLGKVIKKKKTAPAAGNNRNDAGWEAQLAKLAAYKAAHGDCSVPGVWSEDPRLSRWVHAQRAAKKRLDRGNPSLGMTAERAAKLTALGIDTTKSTMRRDRALEALKKNPEGGFA